MLGKGSASVSPKLLALYAEEAMTLEQLMAFTVADDHARQERVWDGPERSYTKEPYAIRLNTKDALLSLPFTLTMGIPEDGLASVRPLCLRTSAQAS